MNRTFANPRRALIFGTAILMLWAVSGLSACSDDQDKRLPDALARLKTPYALSVGETSGAPGKPAVLKNVAFTLPSDKGPVAVTMETVTAEGIAYENLFGSATAPLVEKLVITGLKATGDGIEYVSERLELEGLSPSPETFAAELADYFHSGTLLCEMVGMLVLPDGKTPGLDSLAEPKDFLYSIERFTSKGDKSSARLQDGIVSLFFETTEISEFSSKKYDSIISYNLWGDYDGKRFFTAAELGMADIVLPPEKSDAEENAGMTVGENPLGGDFIVGEVYLKKLVFSPLTADGTQFPFTLETASFDADVSDARQVIAANVAGFALSKEALVSRLDFIPYGEQVRSIAASLPETLTADASLVMDLAPLPDGMYTLSLKPLSFSLNGLAAFSVSMDTRGVSLDDSAASVGLVDMTVTDNGLSDLIFASVGAEQGKTGANLRQETRMQLSAIMFSLQGTLAELCANMLDFLEKPGATLNVKIQPAEMLAPEMLGLMIMSNPEGAGVSSTLTRDETKHDSITPQPSGEADAHSQREP